MCFCRLFTALRSNIILFFVFGMEDDFMFSWNSDVQIEAYRDMIAPVVDAFKYLTQVCFCFFKYISSCLSFLCFCSPICWPLAVALLPIIDKVPISKPISLPEAVTSNSLVLLKL